MESSLSTATQKHSARKKRLRVFTYMYIIDYHSSKGDLASRLAPDRDTRRARL